MRPVAERSGRTARAVYQPIRVAITGTTVSPGIFDSLAALGREESLLRIEQALNRLGEGDQLLGGGTQARSGPNAYRTLNSLPAMPIIVLGKDLR